MCLNDIFSLLDNKYVFIGKHYTITSIYKDKKTKKICASCFADFNVDNEKYIDLFRADVIYDLMIIQNILINENIGIDYISMCPYVYCFDTRNTFFMNEEVFYSDMVPY